MQKKDINPKLSQVQKQLHKAKDEEKEALQAQELFLSTLLDRIKKKKWLATSGKMAFKNTNVETKECFMTLEGKVEGKRKSTMDVALSQLGYDFEDKNGNLLRFVSAATPVEQKEQTQEESVGNAEEAAKDVDKRKRAVQLTKIGSGIEKMDQAQAKVSKDKLTPNIEKYERALEQLKKDALADGEIEDSERQEIEKAETALSALKEKIERGTDTNQERAQVKARNKAKVRKYKAQLDKLAKQLGIR
jgi:hypothetical protein